MKKLLLALVALMLSVSMSHAECGSCEPGKSIAKGAGAVGEFIGKVVSVTVAEPAKGITDGTVKVSDSMGNPVSFTVNSAAKITDASLNVITLGQLKAGSAVKIKAEGKEAKSIEVQ